MMNDSLFQIRRFHSDDCRNGYSSEKYLILMFSGEGRFSVDFTPYTFHGDTILCLTPYQQLIWETHTSIPITELSFHGDFYCIEYHKKEVACNGLLFNNIYLHPSIEVSHETFNELSFFFSKIEDEIAHPSGWSDSILKAYLQLLLALCSREKKQLLVAQEQTGQQHHQELTRIQQLLDRNFLTERSVRFYAEQMGITVSAFSKKTKQHFGKTPSQLIQDRVVLEAKKQLHLTNKSVKEIAAYLQFEDEFYFSRYFKKCVGLSPSHYREKVGISIVAK